MSEQTTAPAGNTAQGAGKSGINSMMRGDIILSLGVIAVLSVLILPMPTPLLDFGLTISLTLGVFILMRVLVIEGPLDLSSFPTILLMATLLRLALNVASTRLILTHGHTGEDAAGVIIGAFGSLLIGNNYVTGIIVFAILIIINLIVITKGAGRIAEVAARFSLDAMPGKQMAIDADLSSGLINEDEARTRRKELEQESTFFGAMDGAAKFVRGDAWAGLLITFINIVGGIIIGTAQKGLSMGEAAQAYTQLTIGDGLVSQIPALVISISAGLLVSKAAEKGSTDKVLFAQLGKEPKAIAMTGGLILSLGILPGIPALPFLFVGGLIGGAAYYSMQQRKAVEVAQEMAMIESQQEEKPKEEPITASLAMDTIRLELGYGLLPLVNDEGDNRLTDQVKGLRRQLAEDMGFILPSVRIQDNLQLPASTYSVRIKEIEAARGEVRPGQLLCMDPGGQEIELAGERTREPTFGLPAMWISEDLREEANSRGYTVVDPSTVITTHVTEIVKDNMSELLSYSEVQKLLDELPQQYQKLVSDVVPSQISVGGLQRVLQNLVNERISIRDLPGILEGVSEASGYTNNIAMITEHVRGRMARQLCDQYASSNGMLPLMTLSPNWEQEFSQSLVGEGEEKQLSMQPSRLQEFIAAVRDAYEKQAMKGETPVLLTSPGIRPYVRSVIERFRPQTIVMSQNEIHPRAKIRTLGQV